MIIDLTQKALEKSKKDLHPDCCGCPKCLHDMYNSPRVYRILHRTISGCVCFCGSVDFGFVAAGCQMGNEPYLNFICKQCNEWEYV